MRILYYVPIFHSPEELGSLAQPVLEIEKRVHGPWAEKIYRGKVEQYWKEIRRRFKVEGIDTPEKCQKMHIYVDGLPQAEDKHIQRLVEKLIELKLPQYLIIQELLEKGATIHGTESQELLLEEYNMWQKVAKGEAPDLKRKRELIRERDEFIARRINKTLPEDEVGILFIGREHKIIEELDKLEEAGGLSSPMKVIYL